ncbi:MAG: hypothetical protein KA158_12320, partial [Leucobacter sp.]|nr:hypothetical protein [Leucobacter sp.]
MSSNTQHTSRPRRFPAQPILSAVFGLALVGVSAFALVASSTVNSGATQLRDGAELASAGADDLQDGLT